MYGYGYQYSAIINGGGGNPAAAIFGTYKSRVLADGGVVENDACAIAFLESIGAGTDIIPLFDADYQAVLTYATSQGYTLPSGGQQTLQNDLVVALKAAGVWSKLDTFANFATDGNSDFALIDWKRLSDYTAINSPTFTSNQGFTGNGTSSYIDSNFNPNTSGVNYTLNDASISIWNNTFVSNNFISGVISSAKNCLRMSASSANVRINMDNNNFTPSVNLSDASKKLRQLNRTSSNDVTAFQDTTSSNHTGASVSIENENQLISRVSGFYSSTQVAFFGMGASLVAENTDFYNALNTYKTAI